VQEWARGSVQVWAPVWVRASVPVWVRASAPAWAQGSALAWGQVSVQGSEQGLAPEWEPELGLVSEPASVRDSAR
jgi:hypothetical protein